MMNVESHKVAKTPNRYFGLQMYFLGLIFLLCIKIVL